ncbi:16S rRNA (guanine(527)-N(7))-methyltransferase RsmG [Nocardioides sp.]|uniref:16S rRNA (guanine(527)-N(7))-methyltransferase RsmG n=1 Tax=Nocardioides sp. TaxID=35761 RepID=UPI0034136B56
MLFPQDRIELVERFAALLATAGVERGLIGPREVPRLWDRHLLNCAMLAEAIPPDVTVADLGSGAGLPGLVLALARPDLHLTLVEPLERRTVFLHEAVDALGLSEVEVLRGRAEALHGVREFDVVTSRALAPLSRLLTWSMPLVAPTGVLLAMKGRSLEAEIEAATDELWRYGCAAPEILELGAAASAVTTGADRLSTTRAVRVAHADPARVAWRPAVDAKSPPRRPRSSTQRSAGRRNSG